jgi:hypothetical protein
MQARHALSVIGDLTKAGQYPANCRHCLSPEREAGLPCFGDAIGFRAARPINNAKKEKVRRISRLPGNYCAIPAVARRSIFIHAVDQETREARAKVVELMLSLDMTKFQHPSAPREGERTPRRYRQIYVKKWVLWWTWSGSNRRPLPCHSIPINKINNLQPVPGAAN